MTRPVLADVGEVALVAEAGGARGPAHSVVTDGVAHGSRQLSSIPSSVTVVKDAAGRYFASFVVQTDPSEVLPETTGEVGIDLGLTHFAVPTRAGMSGARLSRGRRS